MEQGCNRHNAQNVEHRADWHSGESAFLSGSQTSKNRWLIDSGSTSHMTSFKELITEYVALETPEKVTLGDGSQLTLLERETSV